MKFKCLYMLAIIVSFIRINSMEYIQTKSEYGFLENLSIAQKAYILINRINQNPELLQDQLTLRALLVCPTSILQNFMQKHTAFIPIFAESATEQQIFSISKNSQLFAHPSMQERFFTLNPNSIISFSLSELNDSIINIIAQKAPENIFKDICLKANDNLLANEFFSDRLDGLVFHDADFAVLMAQKSICHRTYEAVRHFTSQGLWLIREIYRNNIGEYTEVSYSTTTLCIGSTVYIEPILRIIENPAVIGTLVIATTGALAGAASSLSHKLQVWYEFKQFDKKSINDSLPRSSQQFLSDFQKNNNRISFKIDYDPTTGIINLNHSNNISHLMRDNPSARKPIASPSNSPSIPNTAPIDLSSVDNLAISSEKMQTSHSKRAALLQANGKRLSARQHYQENKSISASIDAISNLLFNNENLILSVGPAEYSHYSWKQVYEGAYNSVKNKFETKIAREINREVTFEDPRTFIPTEWGIPVIFDGKIYKLATKGYFVDDPRNAAYVEERIRTTAFENLEPALQYAVLEKIETTLKQRDAQLIHDANHCKKLALSTLLSAHEKQELLTLFTTYHKSALKSEFQNQVNKTGDYARLTSAVSHIKFHDMRSFLNDPTNNTHMLTYALEIQEFGTFVGPQLNRNSKEYKLLIDLADEESVERFGVDLSSMGYIARDSGIPHELISELYSNENQAELQTKLVKILVELREKSGNKKSIDALVHLGLINNKIDNNPDVQDIIDILSDIGATLPNFNIDAIEADINASIIDYEEMSLIDLDIDSLPDDAIFSIISETRINQDNSTLATSSNPEKAIASYQKPVEKTKAEIKIIKKYIEQLNREARGGGNDPDPNDEKSKKVAKQLKKAAVKSFLAGLCAKTWKKVSAILKRRGQNIEAVSLQKRYHPKGVRLSHASQLDVIVKFEKNNLYKLNVTGTHLDRLGFFEKTGALVLEEVKDYGKGYRSAKINFLGSTKKSGLFPNHWKDKDILNCYKHIFNNPINAFIENETMHLVGIYESQIIKLVIDPSQYIATGYFCPERRLLKVK